MPGVRGIVVALIVLALLVGAIVLYRARSRTSATGRVSFQEFVTDPHVREQLARSIERNQAVLEAMIAEVPAEALVEDLVSKNPHSQTDRALKGKGDEATAALVAAIEDPRFRRPYDLGYDTFGDYRRDGRAPLQTILECLAEVGSPEAAASVGSLATDPDEAIRKAAALLLGAIGTDECVEPLRRLLNDNEEYVRSYAMIGIRRAITAERATPQFRRAVFEAVAPLALRDSGSPGGTAAKCLLELDRERALAFLTTSEALSLHNPELYDNLKAMAEAEVGVPVEKLEPLLSELEPRATNYPFTHALAEALRCVAIAPSPAGRKAIERGLNASSSVVREGAADATLRLVGVKDPYVAFEHMRTVGYEGLTEPQRHFIAIRYLIDQVNNGGFSQYFVNGYSEYWADAVDGFNRIGADSDNAILREVHSMFGPDGPASDSKLCQEQLARMWKDKEDPFDKQDSRFYDDADSRESLLALYVAQHADYFRGDGEQ